MKWLLGLVLLSSVPLAAQTSTTWPYYNAPQWLHVVAQGAADTCVTVNIGWTFNQCLRECDLTTGGATCDLRVHYANINAPHLDPNNAGIKVKYYAHGIAVSDWLDPPFRFTLARTNAALAGLQDGVHDLSIDVQTGTVNRSEFHYVPMLLHLNRGSPFTTSVLVPLLSQDYMYSEYQDTAYGGSIDPGPRVVYVNPADRNLVGHPIVDTVAGPWTTYTPTADLYQVEMAPHTNLFIAAPMWWEFPAGDPDAGLIYARSLVPKHDEDHPGLRPTWHHDRFPFKDGDRGVGWTSAYITGQVTAAGVFYFVETGGPLRELKPDGEIETVAGWRVQAGKMPIFMDQPTATVHLNMELLGDFQEGQYADSSGFRTPLDVAIDPLDDTKFYVVGYEDNCVWKVEEGLGAGGQAKITVFAGDTAHASGYVNGTGHAARFNGPSSIVFDPVNDVIYVADQNNDAIRKITRAGVVTTFEGSPGMWDRIIANGNPTPGLPAYTAQITNRSFANYTVSVAQAGGGMRPDIFQPMTVRVDSTGQLIVSDMGFGSVRRIHPTSHVTTQFANLQAGHWGGASEASTLSNRGWTWFDVDRYGNSGELNSVYSCVFQQGPIPDGETGSHPNEFYGYVSPNSGAGGSTKYIFDDWDPNPDGWGRRDHTDPPHYCWNVAVDPRGGLFMAGGGEHGQTYLRARHATDPVPSDYTKYYNGKVLWKSGGDGFHPSFMLTYGSEGHNYLGFNDAWSITTTTTNAQLVTMFGIETSLLTAAQQDDLFNFLRLNSGVGLTSVPPDPPPPAVDTTPPVVQLTAPAANAVIETGPIAVTVSATATDNVGVVGVIFRANGVAIGVEQNTPPFTVSWPIGSLADGLYTLTATGRDAAGNTTTGTIAVTLRAPTPNPPPNPPPDTTPPTVSLTGPTSPVTGDVFVTALASDEVSVSGVKFFLDGVLRWPEDVISPYSVTWQSTLFADGVHTLTAVARDPSNNVTTSSPLVVTVSNAIPPPDPPPPNPNPVVSLVSDKVAVQVGQTYTLTATTDATLVIDVRLNGAILYTPATDCTAVLCTKTIVRTASVAGTVTETLTSASQTGVPYPPQVVTVTVTSLPVDTTPPTVSGVTPVSGAIVMPGTVTLMATVTDASGVSRVQFSIDGINIGLPDTVSPYSALWTAATGTHTLRVVATDTAGNVTTTSAATITVLAVTSCTADPLIVRMFSWPSGNANNPHNKLEYTTNKATVGLTFVQSPRGMSITDVRGCVANVR